MTKQEYYDLLVDKTLDGTMPGLSPERAMCQYLTVEGRKCAVGILIPDGHPGQKHTGGVYELLFDHRDLNAILPEGVSLYQIGLIQSVHDDVARRFRKEDLLAKFPGVFIEHLNNLQFFQDVVKREVPA